GQEHISTVPRPMNGLIVLPDRNVRRCAKERETTSLANGESSKMRSMRHLMLLRSIYAGLGLLLALTPSGLRAQDPITLPGDKVFPENISSDQAGNIYVGNLGSGGVFRIKRNST